MLPFALIAVISVACLRAHPEATCSPDRVYGLELSISAFLIQWCSSDKQEKRSSVKDNIFIITNLAYNAQLQCSWSWVPQDIEILWATLYFASNIRLVRSGRGWLNRVMLILGCPCTKDRIKWNPYHFPNSCQLPWAK